MDKIKDKPQESDFSIANDIDFWDACMDFYDGKKPLQNNPLQTVGDRIRLIKCLREKGFIITRKNIVNLNMVIRGACACL